jgi:tetratricopeptide (TPR) repeat protein
MLMLDRALTERVVQRAGGNPLFAVEMVREWVRQDALVSTATGHRRRPGAKLTIPQDLNAVSTDRIVGLERELSPDEVTALYLAAALGLRVLHSEWAMVCTLAGQSTPLDLVDLLVSQGLARELREVDGFEFSHSMFREGLLSRMTDASRLKWAHRQCAEMLLASEAQDDASRLACHWSGAGELARALPAFEHGTRRLRRGGKALEAILLHDEWRCALQNAEVAADDAAWAPYWEAGLDLAMYDPGRTVDESLQHLRQGVEQHGWVQSGPKMLLTEAKAAVRRGEMDIAVALSREAVHRQEEMAIPSADVHNFLSHYLTRSGDLDGALTVGQQALQLTRGSDDSHAIAKCHWSLATTLLAQGEAEQAHDQLDLGLKLAVEGGHRVLEAGFTNLLGEICRKSGLLVAAREHYERTVQIWISTAHQEQSMPRINLALVHLEQGDFAAAQGALLACKRLTDNPVQVSTIKLGLTVCAAVGERWEEFDQHLQQASEIILRTRLAEPDNGMLSMLAAERAVQAGEPGRARAAYRLARSHAERLGQAAELARIDQALVGLA